MEGYRAATYGDRFAEVYDDWYPGVSDIDATVRLVARLARRSRAREARVLELGAGTGRLAIPLAQQGLRVVALDASAAMLDRLRANDHDASVTVIEGDVVDDIPNGPFDAVLIAYNTFFGALLDADRQAACFAAVASRLAAKGTFVVEAFVPDQPPRSGSRVEVRSMTVDEVVLSVSTHHPADQRAEGHFVHLREGQPVRLRPWAVRYAPPEELDRMAARARLTLVDRWEDVNGTPFTTSSQRHVSCYRRAS
ncbi:MAG: class I SAM-dependent methyltransferase [Desertimonas sp.]